MSNVNTQRAKHHAGQTYTGHNTHRTEPAPAREETVRPPAQCSANFASFGREIFDRTTANFGDEVCGEEDEAIMEIAFKHGLVVKVIYDPLVHGIDLLSYCEPGDCIWWWGSGKNSQNDPDERAPEKNL